MFARHLPKISDSKNSTPSEIWTQSRCKCGLTVSRSFFTFKCRDKTDAENVQLMHGPSLYSCAEVCFKSRYQSLTIKYFFMAKATKTVEWVDFCLRPSAKDQGITWVLVLVLVHHLVKKKKFKWKKISLAGIKPGSFNSPAKHFIHWATEQYF